MIKIDAVIPWVDGNDPVLNSKRAAYSSSGELDCPSIGGKSRYANLGEIFWCVFSLNRFASFINKIFIVTDGQDPRLEEQLKPYFPEGIIPMEIVDHKDIFKGYEEYLPVFNSRAIETMIWRIPGLSEHFLLLNDDFLVINPVSPEDFFSPEGMVICYGRKFSTGFAKILRKLKPKRNNREVVTFKSSMLASQQILGGGSYFIYLVHTPRPLLKSFFERFFFEHPECIERNIRHRFRDISQFNMQELMYLSLIRKGQCRLIHSGLKDFYVTPKDKRDYIPKKLQKMDKGHYLFCCFNSLDLAGEEDRKLVLDWVRDRLGFNQ